MVGLRRMGFVRSEWMVFVMGEERRVGRVCGNGLLMPGFSFSCFFY